MYVVFLLHTQHAAPVGTMLSHPEGVCVRQANLSSFFDRGGKKEKNERESERGPAGIKRLSQFTPPADSGVGALCLWVPTGIGEKSSIARGRRGRRRARVFRPPQAKEPLPWSPFCRAAPGQLGNFWKKKGPFFSGTSSIFKTRLWPFFRKRALFRSFK